MKYLIIALFVFLISYSCKEEEIKYNCCEVNYSGVLEVCNYTSNPLNVTVHFSYLNDDNVNDSLSFIIESNSYISKKVPSSIAVVDIDKSSKLISIEKCYTCKLILTGDSVITIDNPTYIYNPNSMAYVYK